MKTLKEVLKTTLAFIGLPVLTAVGILFVVAGLGVAGVSAYYVFHLDTTIPTLIREGLSGN